MITPDHDRLKLLTEVKDPDPDPEVMKAVIAQSRDAFERKEARPPLAKKRPGERLRKSLQWLTPLAAAGMAVLAIVLIRPGLMDGPQGDRSRDPVVADAPAAHSEPPTLSRGANAPAEGSVRLGARAPQGQPNQQIVDPQTLPMSIFAGDGVRIGFRLTPEAVLLYLPDTAPDTPIDSQGLLPGEEVELLAAFALPESDIVAVRIRVDAARFWRAYTATGGALARDAELSALISEAPDQAEATQRLLNR